MVKNGKKVVIGVPLMGGEPKLFGSLKDMCDELGLVYGSVRNAIYRDGRYVGDKWVIYKGFVKNNR